MKTTKLFLVFVTSYFVLTNISPYTTPNVGKSTIKYGGVDSFIMYVGGSRFSHAFCRYLKQVFPRNIYRMEDSQTLCWSLVRKLYASISLKHVQIYPHY